MGCVPSVAGRHAGTISRASVVHVAARGLELIKAAHRIELVRIMRARGDAKFVQYQNAMRRTDVALPIPRELIALERTKFLFKGTCYDRIGLRNYDTRRRRLRIGVSFDADFRDQPLPIAFPAINKEFRPLGRHQGKQ